MTASLLQFLAMFAVEILALHLFFKWIERRWPERPVADLSHLDADARERIAKRPTGPAPSSAGCSGRC